MTAMSVDPMIASAVKHVTGHRIRAAYRILLISP
jgi:hypothetical protein